MKQKVYITIIIGLIIISFFLGRKYIPYTLINKSKYEEARKERQDLIKKIETTQAYTDSLTKVISRLEKELQAKPKQILIIDKKYEKVFNNIRNLSIDDQLRFYSREIQKYDSAATILEIGQLIEQPTYQDLLGQRYCYSNYTILPQANKFNVSRKELFEGSK